MRAVPGEAVARGVSALCPNCLEVQELTAQPVADADYVTQPNLGDRVLAVEAALEALQPLIVFATVMRSITRGSSMPPVAASTMFCTTSDGSSS